MIEISKTNVMNWEAAIRGMRNPMNSWDKSDSCLCKGADGFEDCTVNGCGECPRHEDFSHDIYCVGENDLGLMRKLAKAGSDHAKYRRMIIVSADIVAPMYWWAEADTYKVGTVRNSCSKMHKLLAKPFEMSDFSFDKLSGYRNEVKQFRPHIDEEMVAQESWCWFDADYDISDLGRVKHKFKNHYRIISGSLHQDGFIFVTLHGKQYPLHRLVAKLWHPDTYSEELVVNHKDGNKQNNFASNLEWVTQKENIVHSIENGLQPNHARGYTGKFDASERETIKRLWDSGEMSKRQIAAKYNVSHTCVCDIINDKYKYAEKVNLYEEVAKPIVDFLNELRDSYLATSDADAKRSIWYAILQILPESYNQRSTIMLNYEVLHNIYHARKNHKLDEWHVLCDWIESLPYAKELITFEP